MSVSRKIAEMRAQADFLEAHATLIESLEYETVYEQARAGIQAVREEYGRDSSVYKDAESSLTYVTWWEGWTLQFNIHGPNARNVMMKLRRGFGGVWEKEAYSGTFALRYDGRGDDLRIRIEADREAVCTPRVVGQREKVTPAVEAREAQPERIEMEDIVDWDCGNLATA
jgi:hypothetical protein